MLRRKVTVSTCMMSRPPTLTIPASASIMRLMMRMVVVFPHPDGPMSAQTSPSGILKVSRSTAGRAVPGNCFTRSTMSITEASRGEASRYHRPLQPPEQLIGADGKKRCGNGSHQQLRQRHHRDAGRDEVAEAAATDIGREHRA